MKYQFAGINLLLVLLGGCTGIQRMESGVNAEPIIGRPSFLETSRENIKNTPPQDQEIERSDASIKTLKPIHRETNEKKTDESWQELFLDTRSHTLAADKLNATDFIHNVFGELLEINFILDPSIAEIDFKFTLDFPKPVSSRSLAESARDYLAEAGIETYIENKILYFKARTTAEAAIIGIGKSKENVPLTKKQILQIIPVTYGTKISIERTINQLLDVQILPDPEQNAFFVRGGREGIIRAIELINLLDSPANRGKFISLIELTYIDPEYLSSKIFELLKTEGVESSGPNSQTLKNITLVSLPRIGGVAVFATGQDLIDRVTYWADILDVPGKGSGKKYFKFSPQNARASDIMDSLAGLMGLQDNSSSLSGRATGPENPLNPASGQSATGQAPSPDRASSAAIVSGELNVVVDERSNALLFYTTGENYQKIEGLLYQLDVLPKQVLLDVLIAEVSLQDEFRFGFEWALRSNGINYSTQGAFGADFAGLAISTLEDTSAVNATLLSADSLINVVSRPTLLVRDGTTARIDVGSSIAVTGSTTIDPIIGQRQTVATVYRKTGVDLTITPTVNAEDVIIMEISQSISNTVEGSSGSAGNPDIFERALSTEVIGRSGETILLAGLISETTNDSRRGIPLAKDIPLIGSFFGGESNTRQKTELVIFITGRVIDNSDILNDLTQKFKEGLEALE